MSPGIVIYRPFSQRTGFLLMKTSTYVQSTIRGRRGGMRRIPIYRNSLVPMERAVRCQSYPTSHLKEMFLSQVSRCRLGRGRTARKSELSLQDTVQYFIIFTGVCVVNLKRTVAGLSHLDVYKYSKSGGHLGLFWVRKVRCAISRNSE